MAEAFEADDVTTKHWSGCVQAGKVIEQWHADWKAQYLSEKEAYYLAEAVIAAYREAQK